MSRFHARIVRRRGAHVLEDLGSRNGTYLNGGRLAEGVALVHDDRVALGDIELCFQVGDLAEENDESWTHALPKETTVLLSSRELTYEEQQTRPGTEGTGGWEMGLLPALHTVASALISDYPLDELTQVVLDRAREAVRAERGALLLLPRKPVARTVLRLPMPPPDAAEDDDETGALESPEDRPSKVPTLPLEVLTLKRKVSTVPDPDDLELVASHGFESGEEVSISRTILRQVMENERAVLTLDAQSDSRFDSSMSLRLQGVRSILCLPLWNNHRVLGALYLDQRMRGRSFTESDLRLAGLVANMAAVKIENLFLLEERLENRRLEEQLRVGAEIQRRLLPDASPEVEGYDFFGVNRSCEQVGGDYYDFVPHGDDGLSIVLADVAGKGVGAALLMAMLQASLRALCHDGRPPARVVERLDRLLLERTPASKFATLFYGELDLVNHTLEYVNAGHVPPGLLRRANGEIEELPPTGPVVGLIEGACFESRTVSIEPGATLLLCTDGITELENPKGEELGFEILRELLAEVPLSAAELSETIHTRQISFCGSESFDDDSTVVVMRRLETP